MNTSAVTSTGADHATRSSRQLPPTSGSTSNVVSAGASVPPITSPLVEVAAPSATRCGIHSRTSAGNAGCMIATPKPITKVAANSVQTLMRAAAACRRRGGDQHADRQRAEGAEPMHQQRARHRGEREHQQRQAHQEADLRFAQMQVVVDQRDHRRHRQDGDAHADAGEPEQAQELEQPGAGRDRPRSCARCCGLS